MKYLVVTRSIAMDLSYFIGWSPYRISVAFLVFFLWTTVYGGSDPCTVLGPGVLRCRDLCTVPWGATQVHFISEFLHWHCLPASVKVRECSLVHLLFVFYSPVTELN